MIYLDNGPVARSHVFQQVMRYLDIDVRAHLPQGKDGRRATARSKGKVERPFRTVKEMHETLYHFHEPKDEDEANAWLMNFLLRYNDMQHRSEPHSRMEDWLENLPSSGVRAACSWERFCTFAREPERRKVGSDTRVSVAGVNYEVDPDLAGETVMLWWGIFDNELYIGMATSASDLIHRPAARSLYIDIARSRRLRRNNVQTESTRSPNNWRYLVRHWRDILMQLCLSVTSECR